MTPTETALATTSDTLYVFSGIAAFDAAQRMAKALCSSTLVPKDYQGQQGLSNCLIALEIAGRMGLSPLVVMQNMVPINGKPTWSSSFLIGTVNASGRFSPLRFQFDNEDSPTWCYCEATEKASGEILKSQKITIEMAKNEGWWSRNGSKWPTLTGQMLRYRAASFWVKVYCPEISLGLATQEEALDVEAVTVEELPSPAVPAPIQAEPVEAAQPPSPAPAPAAAPAPAELQQQVLDRCIKAGLTEAGLKAFARRVSEGAESDLLKLPTPRLKAILQAGVSHSTVAECNKAPAN